MLHGHRHLVLWLLFSELTTRDRGVCRTDAHEPDVRCISGYATSELWALEGAGMTRPRVIRGRSAKVVQESTRSTPEGAFVVSAVQPPGLAAGFTSAGLQQPSVRAIVGSGVDCAEQGGAVPGPESFETHAVAQLYSRIAQPLASAGSAADFYRTWHLLSMDGLCLDLPDTDANVERFGRPPSSRGDGRGGAFPQIRVLVLAGCGSHAIIDAAVGSYNTGEQTLAQEILRSLHPGQLLLADRGFFSYPLWKTAAAPGADLLWRVKSNAVLPVQTRHPDGSFASHIYPGTTARRNKTDGIAVRE